MKEFTVQQATIALIEHAHDIDRYISWWKRGELSEAWFPLYVELSRDRLARRLTALGLSD